jgi:hypothetical protein
MIFRLVKLFFVDVFLKSIFTKASNSLIYDINVVWGLYPGWHYNVIPLPWNISGLRFEFFFLESKIHTIKELCDFLSTLMAFDPKDDVVQCFGL